jgi:hypothetical protein
MKHLILIILLCLPFTTVNAGWFSKTPDPIPEYKEKIVALENQLSAQAIHLNRWQIASGSLGIGCVFLLIIGTALGAKTRTHHHHASSPRRMGGSTPPANLNGRKPHLMGKTAQDNTDQALAA